MSVRQGRPPFRFSSRLLFRFWIYKLPSLVLQHVHIIVTVKTPSGGVKGSTEPWGSSALMQECFEVVSLTGPSGHWSSVEGGQMRGRAFKLVSSLLLVFTVVLPFFSASKDNKKMTWETVSVSMFLTKQSVESLTCFRNHPRDLKKSLLLLKAHLKKLQKTGE